MTSFTVTRQIFIDAGHRVLTHGSKCRNLHGHRYMIEAVCEAGRLQEAGEQSDMVLDFGFLKDEMMAVIDAPCDHGFLAHVNDDQLLSMFRPDGNSKGDGTDWLEFLHPDGISPLDATGIGPTRVMSVAVESLTLTALN